MLCCTMYFKLTYCSRELHSMYCMANSVHTAHTYYPEAIWTGLDCTRRTARRRSAQGTRTGRVVSMDGWVACVWPGRGTRARARVPAPLPAHLTEALSLSLSNKPVCKRDDYKRQRAIALHARSVSRCRSVTVSATVSVTVSVTVLQCRLQCRLKCRLKCRYRVWLVSVTSRSCYRVSVALLLQGAPTRTPTRVDASTSLHPLAA